ncbi:MAG: copper-binding protein [Burkholderiales bacterium]
MKHTVTRSLLLILLTVAGAASAGERDQAMNREVAQNGMRGEAVSNASAAQPHRAHGRVNKVDLEGGKVNLTHGPIKTLGWPGMTMDFKVVDKSILKGINPGQEVDFDLRNEGPGKFYITRITPSK